MAEAVTQIVAASRTVELALEQPFYIPMTGPAARPRRSLKHDDTFIVLDSHGDIGASAGGPDGLFNADTRYLARLELVFEDMQPLLLGTNLRDDNSSLTVDLTNPDVYQQGRLVLQKDMLHIVRTVFLWRGTAYQRIGLQNHGERRASFDMTLLFDNDFADLFEVRGETRPRRGIGTAKLVGPSDVVLDYKGLDGEPRMTALHFDPRPTRLATNNATWHLELEPQEVSSLFVSVSCNKTADPKRGRFFPGLLAHRREMRRATSGITSIETSNNIFNEVLCQSMADLNMLMTETPEGRYPYAGIPWYSTTFGRDGLITAMQMLWIDPRVACGVLKRLAHYQATAVDPLNDAAPGKILHEMRGGEMAALREVPFAQYYGSVDATPLFVLLAGLYSERTGDHETIEELWPTIEAALRWIDGPGDPDGDGFVEYQRATEEGLAQSGLEGFLRCDLPCRRHARRGHRSRYARCRAMSSPPSGWRRVARSGSDVARSRDRAGDRSRTQLGAAFRAGVLVRGARHLCAGARRREAALARCGRRMPATPVQRHRSATDRARRVAADLLRPHFFPAGASAPSRIGEARYNPMSYHNGSIWPHDNALIALGLCALRPEACASSSSSRACSTPRPIWTCGACPNCSAASAASGSAGRRSIRSPARRRPGPAPRRSRCCKPRSGSNSMPSDAEIRLRNPAAARLPQRSRAARPATRRIRASTLLIRRHGDGVSMEVLRRRGQIQVSIVLAR